MHARYLALRWTPSVFEKPQATYRTQATRTVGSASMRPSPYLPRFSLLKGRMKPGSEIVPQTYPAWYILSKHSSSLFANISLLLLLALWQGIQRTKQFWDQRRFRRDNGTYRSSSKHVWRVSSTNPKKKTDKSNCGFPNFSAGLSFACVIKLPKTCPAMNLIRRSKSRITQPCCRSWGQGLHSSTAPHSGEVAVHRGIDAAGRTAAVCSMMHHWNGVVVIAVGRKSRQESLDK